MCAHTLGCSLWLLSKQTRGNATRGREGRWGGPCVWGRRKGSGRIVALMTIELLICMTASWAFQHEQTSPVDIAKVWKLQEEISSKKIHVSRTDQPWRGNMTPLITTYFDFVTSLRLCNLTGIIPPLNHSPFLAFWCQEMKAIYIKGKESRGGWMPFCSMLIRRQDSREQVKRGRLIQLKICRETFILCTLKLQVIKINKI